MATDIQIADRMIRELEEEVESLKATIKGMRSCQNCKHGFINYDGDNGCNLPENKYYTVDCPCDKWR